MSFNTPCASSEQSALKAARDFLTSLLAIAVLYGSCFGSVRAQVVEGATTVMAAEDQRPEIFALMPQYRLVGKGRLTIWGLQIYDARLWALPGFGPDKLDAQTFALELAYLRGFENKAIAERSITEMRRAAPVSNEQASAWTAEMLRVLPNTRVGDRITGVNKPGTGALFLVNGKPSGEIRDPEFARLFFGIWLSPQTSEPKLRNALLVGAQ